MVVLKFIGIIIRTNQQGLSGGDFLPGFLRVCIKSKVIKYRFDNKNIGRIISKATTLMEIGRHH
jgi:hypothetical protein